MCLRREVASSIMLIVVKNDDWMIGKMSKKGSFTKLKTGDSSKNDFIAQAGILAVAGIVSRIIGLLYTSPLSSAIGDVGMGYYYSAYNFYTIILLISSYSIPAAISKVIAQKLAVEEYRNAHRLFYGALIYVLVVGGIASCFLFFGAGLFVEENAIPVLRTFAPTIFVYGILGVLRGYFQAHKSMTQTSLSQIIEQIANAIVSIVAAMLLIQTVSVNVMEAAGEATVLRRATLGAVGGAMGTGAGVLIGLVFMLFMYGGNRKFLLERMQQDRHKAIDSYRSIFKTITFVVTPFILSTAIANLSGTANNYIYNKALPHFRLVDEVARSSRWGIFGNSMKVSNIPIAFATAMATAMLPAVAQLTAAGKVEEAKEKIAASIKTIMVLSIPCAVGLFALAKPVMYFLFPRPDEIISMGGRFLMVLAPSVVFYALSTLSSQILQGIGKLNAPIINAAISLVVQTVVALGLLLFTGLDVYSIAIANTIYSGLLCILNQMSVRKAIDYRQEIKYTFLLPFVASAIMGVAAFLVYRGSFLLVKSMRLCLLVAIAAGGIVYFVVLIKIKGITEQELRRLPKGHLLVKLAKKCKLL